MDYYSSAEIFFGKITCGVEVSPSALPYVDGFEAFVGMAGLLINPELLHLPTQCFIEPNYISTCPEKGSYNIMTGSNKKFFIATPNKSSASDRYFFL